MKCLIFLALFVAVTIAYDFKDSFFNQELLQNFGDLNDFDSERYRTKRDTEEAEKTEEVNCKPHSHFSCCDEQFDKENFKTILKAKNECYMEIYGNATDDDHSFDPFDCSKIEEVKEKITCTVQCIAKKFNLLDEKNNILKDAVLEHLKTKYKEVEWRVNAAEQVVDACMEVIQSEEDKSESDADKCNPQSIKAMHCIWKEFSKACPKDKQIASDKCDRLREKIASGKISSPQKSFYKHFHHHHHHE